ncbi:DUF3152 domain-containing protein [Pseudokineococcus basanitobsidens]|uniref:DUF3152 domain-containing protein n=1 Tax=Pseudokineococcus basanitobsidens TaxID=1926649 RepID=A0ABU8RIJ3_9ACTN
MVSSRVVRRRRQVLAGALVVGVAGVVLGVALGGEDPSDEAGGEQVQAAVVEQRAGDGTAPSPGATTGTATRAGDGGAQPAGESSGGPDGRSAAAAGTDPDRAAGVLSPEVPDAASGRLVAVPGAEDPGGGAPADAEVVGVRVLVEEGLPADAGAVAGTVLDVLQDPRGWAQDGWAFARTDGAEGSRPVDVDVVLASPDLAEELCAPLDTDGVLSCRTGDRVVLTWYRWVRGAEAYGEDREDYRRYLLAHEVGHFLGHGHERCPGPGEPAPVMLQQTKGLQGCTPNPWPHP